MQGPINSKLDCNGVKHNRVRNDEMRFSKIRQENKMRREEIRKK
jgi:hypothetical protein